MFWNRRLKNKQSTTLQGVYADYVANKKYKGQNRSLNISPR